MNWRTHPVGIIRAQQHCRIPSSDRGKNKESGSDFCRYVDECGGLTMQRQKRVDEGQVAVQEEKDLRNTCKIRFLFIESFLFLLLSGRSRSRYSP